MKIINSHYIPLPDPHWLIVEPNGLIYEQIGTLTVVTEGYKTKDGSFVDTHGYPVVANATADIYDESNEELTEPPLTDWERILELCDVNCKNLTELL